LSTEISKHEELRAYEFIVGQKGLMAGLGWQGSKITQINP